MPIPDPTPAANAGKASELLVWFQINETISIVALTVGILIFIIAYFAGGKENLSKLIASTVLSILIAVLAMPLFIKFGRFLGIMNTRGGEIFILLLLLFFISGLSAHIYEIITVSAREARPD